MKKFYSDFLKSKNRYYIIQQDTPGFYIYEYHNKGLFLEDLMDDTYCPQHQEDYLQDTYEIAKEFAFEDFGVPLDSWQEAPIADNKIEGK